MYQILQDLVTHYTLALVCLAIGVGMLSSVGAGFIVLGIGLVLKVIYEAMEV